MSTGAQPLPHRARVPHRRALWSLVALVAVAVIAVALGRTVFTATPAPSPPTDVRDRVQALVGGSIPGAMLFVREGDRSYTVTAGYADKTARTPMAAGDSFQIGSTTSVVE